MRRFHCLCEESFCRPHPASALNINLVLPWESTARYRYLFLLTSIYIVSSTRTESLVGFGCGQRSLVEFGSISLDPWYTVVWSTCKPVPASFVPNSVTERVAARNIWVRFDVGLKVDGQWNGCLDSWSGTTGRGSRYKLFLPDRHSGGATQPLCGWGSGYLWSKNKLF